ncbi:hypothetical protein [Streptomyces sp. NPDC017941]|uniref:hypothetical protein n=1 Tax=Streptomyces sp. NPDC017941 TaxID=3365018 RepID=UPI0037A908A6
MASHGEPQDRDDSTYRVTVRNVTGHTTVGRNNRVVGGIGATAGQSSEVTEAQREELRREFAGVRQLIEDLDGVGEREKGAAVDRLEELEAAATDDEPDVRAMGRVRAWFAEKLPEMLETVTGLLLHPTIALLVQAAGDEAAAGFDGLTQTFGSFASGEG